MSVRAAVVAAVMTSAACSACGPVLNFDRPEVIAPTATAVTAAPTLEPYIEASADLSRVARRFVTTALTYDSTAETRQAFLARVWLLVTRQEAVRLRQSARNRLNWPALSARGESVTFVVAGISRAAATGSPTIVVEGTRTTHTKFATVRDHIAVRLEFERVAGKWLVTRARGAGL